MAKNKIQPLIRILWTIVMYFSLFDVANGGDTGPWVPIDFDNGIGFNHSEGAYDVALRFRSQNLLQYESSVGSRKAQVTGQPRRLRLRFGGWVVNERLRFNLQLSFTRGDMDWENTQFPNIVRDATVMYRIFPTFEVAFGQTKLPGNRQRIVSSGELQFVDRSIVNRAFNLDRDFGFQAKLKLGNGDQPSWTLLGAITTGGGRNSSSRDASAFALTSRLEVLPLGEFKKNGDYFEGDILKEEKPKFSIGAFASRFHGIDRSGGSIGIPLQSSSTERGFFTWGGDFLCKYQGLSISFEYLRKSLISWAPAIEDFEGALSAYSPPLDGEGLNIQTGYLIAEGWETVARYSVVTPETINIEPFSQQQKQFAFGLNRYLLLHRVKVQTDFSRSLFQTPRSMSSINGQWMARFQIELGI